MEQPTHCTVAGDNSESDLSRQVCASLGGGGGLKEKSHFGVWAKNNNMVIVYTS